MSHRELFSEFLENLNLDLKQAKKISYHYRKITKSLNLAFRGTSSRVPHISRKRTTPGCTRCHTRPGTLVNQNGFILQVPVICYVLMRGRTRFCGLSAWACQKRSVVWLSHLPDVMASVSFIWMPTLNACRVYPLSTGNQKQHEIINHGNSAGYSDCVAAGQYRLRIGNYL